MILIPGDMTKPCEECGNDFSTHFEAIKLCDTCISDERVRVRKRLTNDRERIKHRRAQRRKHIYVR